MVPDLTKVTCFPVRILKIIEKKCFGKCSSELHYERSKQITDVTPNRAKYSDTSCAFM